MLGGGPGVGHLCADALNRLAGGQLQAANQGLDFVGRACGALCQRAHFFRDHGKAAAHFTGAGRFDSGIQGQQVGLVGNRSNHRQHATDGGRLFGQAFDGLRVTLYFTDQGMQPGQALANHPLPLGHRKAGTAAGIGSLAGVARHLGNGGLQLTQRVADLCAIAGLALGAAVQSGAQLGQGPAAAGHLLGIQAQGAHQVHQIAAQAV